MSEKDKFKFSSSFLKKPFLLNNNNNNDNENKEEKDDQSILTDIQFNNKNIDINNPLKESLTEFNSSQIPESEKSMIISSYKLISKETIEKAKKLNKQFKQTPFWIKFFEEIENDSLKNNSSYFKINNKNEYIKNLVNMIQRDADLYDKLQKSKEIKQETENEIKKLIQENNNINNINTNNDIIINNNLEKNKNDINTINNTSKIKRHNSSNININNFNKNNNIDNDNNNINIR